MRSLPVVLFASLTALSAHATSFDTYQCRSADGRVQVVLGTDVSDDYSANLSVTVDGKKYDLPATSEDDDGNTVHTDYSLVENDDVPGYALSSVVTRKEMEPSTVLSLIARKDAIHWGKERIKGGISVKSGTMSGILTLHHVSDSLFPDRKVAVACKMSSGND